MATTSIHCIHGQLSCVVHLTEDEFHQQDIAAAVHRAARVLAAIGPREQVLYDGGEDGHSEWYFGEWSKQTIDVFEREDEYLPPTRSQVRGIVA